MSGSGDVSLTIVSVSGGERLTFFTKRFFYFSRPPGFGLAFDAAEKNVRFGRIQCQRNKESSRAKRKRQVFFCKRSVTVEVKSKVIPTSSLKIEGREMFVGAKDWKKRDG